MSLATMLRSRMQVLPAKTFRNVGGATDFKWDESGPAYGCNVQPVDTVKRITLEAMNILVSHQVYFDAKALTLGADDRLKIGSRVFVVKSLEQPEDQPGDWPGLAFVVETRI